ncbi:MAG: hypothetical protein NTX53_03300 [candidate division WOR-3 bacterium]|nr:hypothetical protein [candidate division WOR-3 bacterium]
MAAKPPHNSSYVEAVVAFVDLLGFKDMVKHAGNSIANPMAAIEALRSALAALDDDWHMPDASLLTFSDMAMYVSLLRPAADELAGYELEWVYGRVAETQRKLLNMDLLIQGGVAKGPVYCDTESNTVFGPAVNLAVKMASHDAVFPRVVVASELVTEDERQANMNGDWGPVVSFGDGVWFVNYLYPGPDVTFGVGHPTEKNCLALLANHKKAVLHYAERACSPDTQSKIIWARTYHDAYVSSFLEKLPQPGDKAKMEQLLIEDKGFFSALLTPPNALTQTDAIATPPATPMPKADPRHPDC